MQKNISLWLNGAYFISVFFVRLSVFTLTRWVIVQLGQFQFKLSQRLLESLSRRVVLVLKDFRASDWSNRVLMSKKRDGEEVAFDRIRDVLGRMIGGRGRRSQDNIVGCAFFNQQLNLPCLSNWYFSPIMCNARILARQWCSTRICCLSFWNRLFNGSAFSHSVYVLLLAGRCLRRLVWVNCFLSSLSWLNFLPRHLKLWLIALLSSL